MGNRREKVPTGGLHLIQGKAETGLGVGESAAFEGLAGSDGAVVDAVNFHTGFKSSGMVGNGALVQNLDDCNAFSLWVDWCDHVRQQPEQ
ncbi:hypothetical protein RvY_13300 [Ramazzottius varieornatus]|uniref:Uncharacterized protein n=1 Tax=Ramazzottius varieornatus TaxID=947166 RepID=A0A1D1VPL6_RAMVA|nr:hypothetical protein RvY_13300 [Ramazzottius varieornatus]